MTDLNNLSKEQKLELLTALEEKTRRVDENKLLYVFPEKGEFARSGYPKQLQFFEAGAKFKERALIAGNRVGKSFAGGTELAYHLTGMYPDWWQGKRFNQAINAIAAGKTNQTTRDIIQAVLLGKRQDLGTGLLPKHTIQRCTTRQGVADAVLDIYVTHVSGGTSHLILKSYEQGRGAFEGISAHVVWFDEEPDDVLIYSEALVRTATTGGIVYCTFTPLEGLSELVLSFLPGAVCPENGIVNDYKYVVMASWDDVPHEIDRKALMSACLPYEIEARSKGIPAVGAGKIYPLPESEIIVEPFPIPQSWPRAYGIDPGWSRTAVIWGAIDPNNGTIYLYDEYYRGQAEPAIHVNAIKARGEWICGAIDYAGTNQTDGQRLLTQYTDQGLNVVRANKAVDAGILKCYSLMSEGKLKAFNTCQNWIKEFRVYRYNKVGHVNKENDHLMDAMRYFVMTGVNLVATPPQDKYFNMPTRNTSAFGTDSVTGY